MYDSIDLAWAAGFFDGEGCFARSGTPVATASQSQLESLDVFANIVGVGTLNGPYEKATRDMQRRKPQWVFQAYGRNARTIFMLLAPWLGSYRTAQAIRALEPDLDGVASPEPFDSHPKAERLAWASGFFDAEGCFSVCGRTGGLAGRITHTDRELLDRFQAVIGFGKVYGPYAPHRTSFGKRATYVYTATGFEKVQAMLAMLWPNLGSAKRIKAMLLLGDHLRSWKCGHARGRVWKMHCPICFKPGPKPRSGTSKSLGTRLPGL